MNDELSQELASKLSSLEFKYRFDEKYLSPMHNSFLTFAFHIGLLPSILILIPLGKASIYVFRRNKIKGDKNKDFLILSFIGSSVWASFNVVLELPHSSAFYWLIYFSLIYSFLEDQDKEKNKD